MLKELNVKNNRKIGLSSDGSNLWFYRSPIGTFMYYDTKVEALLVKYYIEAFIKLIIDKDFTSKAEEIEFLKEVRFSINRTDDLNMIYNDTPIHSYTLNSFKHSLLVKDGLETFINEYINSQARSCNLQQIVYLAE